MLHDKRRFKIGDVVRCTYPGAEHLRREIAAVSSFGYEWRYPGLREVTPWGEPNRFSSESTGDPLMVWWEKDLPPAPAPIA